jgi:hypothetical protein
MGRKRRGSVTAALKACAGVGGPLEACGLALLRSLFAEHGSRLAVAELLGVTDRTLRRIVNAYGARIEALEGDDEDFEEHPPVRWCSCVRCRGARAA